MASTTPPSSTDDDAVEAVWLRVPNERVVETTPDGDEPTHRPKYVAETAFWWTALDDTAETGDETPGDWIVYAFDDPTVIREIRTKPDVQRYQSPPIDALQIRVRGQELAEERVRDRLEHARSRIPPQAGGPDNGLRGPPTRPGPD